MKEKFNIFKRQAKVAVADASSNTSKKVRNFNLESVKNFKLRKSTKHTAIFLGIVVVIIFMASVALTRFFVTENSDKRITPPEALAVQNLNTKFEFPIRDQENEIVANVSYEIEKANLQNEFIYQGKLAKSVKGRTFLVFDLKITNPYEQGIEINTIDYIRVKRNGSEELLAPEIHNDPIQVQANSTKYTRIGLPINETDKNLTVLVGELKGEKQEVKLNF